MSFPPSFKVVDQSSSIETPSDNSNARFVACFKGYFSDQPEIRGKVAIAFEVNTAGKMIAFEMHERSQPELSLLVKEAFQKMQTDEICWIPGSKDGVLHQMRVEFMLNFGVTCHTRMEEL